MILLQLSCTLTGTELQVGARVTLTAPLQRLLAGTAGTAVHPRSSRQDSQSNPTNSRCRPAPSFSIQPKAGSFETLDSNYNLKKKKKEALGGEFSKKSPAAEWQSQTGKPYFQPVSHSFPYFLQGRLDVFVNYNHTPLPSMEVTVHALIYGLPRSRQAPRWAP